MLDLRKNLIERRTIELDSDIAKHYLKFNTYETQRTIRIAHVMDLSEKMRNGLFRFGEVAFAIRNGHSDLLINGQHVCSAVIETGETVPCILERFSIKNDRELSEAFRQFEILPRSLQDMVRVEANSLKLSWPLWLSSLIVSTAIVDRTGQPRLGGPASTGSVESRKNKYMSKDDKVKLLGGYLKEGVFLSEIFCVGGKRAATRHLQRKAVALIIIKSWRIDKNDAFLFWSRVRDGENLTREMPEMKLREFLMQTKASNASLAYRARRISDHEFAYRCVQAWNAFRQGTKTKLTYYPDNTIPKLK